MKITGQQPPRTTELATGKSREADIRPDRKRDEARESAPPAGSQASLTTSRIREAIRNTPDIRADRVDAVREKIRAGEYKVDADRLATRLLRESVREDLEKP